MTNPDNEKEKTQLSKGTIRTGIILGASAGFIGGACKFSQPYDPNNGILMLVLFLPILAPISGLIPAFIISKFVKVEGVYLLLSIVAGFLIGYFPFNYWFAM